MVRAARVLPCLAWLSICGVCHATASVNTWGWVYNNGAPLTLERRLNLVAAYLTCGSSLVLAARYVKCSFNCAKKWVRAWQRLGHVRDSAVFER